jgi:hypothetical protein
VIRCPYDTVLFQSSTEPVINGAVIHEKTARLADFFAKSHAYAVFPTIAKGGLMYTATLAGRKFTYTPRGG